MITISQARTIEGELTTLEIPSQVTETLDATGLTVFPGLIDPHVHFRIPGQAYKEDWITGAQASLRGGYTTVLDMPNNVPACITPARLADKISQIESQLKTAGIPLHYGLYFGADRHHFQHLHEVRDQVVGVKVFMGSSTGDLLMDDESSLHAIFALCAKLNLLVAVHAEDECEIQAQRAHFAGTTDVSCHSKIRSPKAAEKAVKFAIDLVRLYGTRLYILHVSTQGELAQIQKAKQEGLPVFAEVCPHHLFLSEADYATLGTRGQMNPPLRTLEDQAALFQAIAAGVIDTIGSDHAPHTMAEKDLPYGQAPSGVPGIETTLPLLLTAYHQGKITLANIIRLTHSGPRALFQLPHYPDVVLVDLPAERTVHAEHLKTKCGWSPFTGKVLKGWPEYVILDKIYPVGHGRQSA